MSVFKRRKKDHLEIDVDGQEVEAAEADETRDGVDAGESGQTAPAATGRPQGPWDAADAPERDAPRLDLGALQVPVFEGVEVRVDVNATGQVVAATLVNGASALQLSVFAAPRTDGIWDEVREDIATALGESGGRAEPAEGPFGTELRASVPTKVPDRGTVMAPARFLGVDGPRWFVRGLVTGAAAVDPAQAEQLEQAFRDVVVVRGADPMAVRDPLPLRLPPDVAPQAAQAAAQQNDPLPMPERGPEITEIR